MPADGSVNGADPEIDGVIGLGGRRNEGGKELSGWVAGFRGDDHRFAIKENDIGE